MERRRLALLIAVVASVTVVGVASAAGQDSRAARPNILWLTSEDNGPQLGAYGDAYATTPHLDRLAAAGVRYLHAWSNAPVCAPARTAIVTGLYPTSTGAEHMRSMTRLPPGMRMFPALLRDAGYYTANNVKEDYNLEKAADVWDDSSAAAHWRGRRPGQPFFAVFNSTLTHESSIRKRPHAFVHDPARAPLPAYHPDTPEVRQDWAEYYDRMTEMDAAVGERLAELAADGLADDTIVVYFGDHGPGMPRLKRWPFNSGLHVPLIVYVPPRFRPQAGPLEPSGGASRRLVSFVDLAPTMLSLAGVAPPAWMQGRAFLGPHTAAAPAYLFGFRGRMDERIDLVRSVTDGRYVYVRNYMPHRIYGAFLAYMFETPTTRVWKRMYDEGRLSPPRTFFWETKPAEELYDLRTDPHEVRNLAGAGEHASVLQRLRSALQDHLRAVRDVGFIPEGARRRMSASTTPYELGHDPAQYDVDRVLRAAEEASDPHAPVSALARALSDPDPSVRYWGATGALVRGRAGATALGSELARALDDPDPDVRIVAAEALARFGDAAAAGRARGVLLAHADVGRHAQYVALAALNALSHVPELPREIIAAVAQLPTADPSIHPREDDYLLRMVEYITRTE